MEAHLQLGLGAVGLDAAQQACGDAAGEGGGRGCVLAAETCCLMQAASCKPVRSTPRGSLRSAPVRVSKRRLTTPLSRVLYRSPLDGWLPRPLLLGEQAARPPAGEGSTTKALYPRGGRRAMKDKLCTGGWIEVAKR